MMRLGQLRVTRQGLSRDPTRRDPTQERRNEIGARRATVPNPLTVRDQTSGAPGCSFRQEPEAEAIRADARLR